LNNPFQRGGKSIPFLLAIPSSQMSHQKTWKHLFADRSLSRIAKRLITQDPIRPISWNIAFYTPFVILSFDGYA
jgi:hypothetical protein